MNRLIQQAEEALSKVEETTGTLQNNQQVVDDVVSMLIRENQELSSRISRLRAENLELRKENVLLQ